MAAQATCSRSTTTATAVPSRSMALRASARAGAPNRRMAFSSSIGGVAALHAATPPARRAARSSAAVDVRSEISYVMVKPDGVQRGLVGEIISRFERKGFKLVGLKLFQATREIAEEHYEELASKPFYPKLVDYILSGPVVAMVWEGKGVVKSARKLIGATNPLEAEPGTIRGDYAVDVGRNVVHGSDSPENGERETALWFCKDGIVAWDPTLTPWLLE